MWSFKFTCGFLLLLSLVNQSHNASLSLAEQKKYKDLIEGQGLYTGDGDVEVLTNSNFKRRVYGRPNAWVVEFYNSWCGFCQRFAPSWMALATDIKSWQGAVNVGAIDCATDDNSDLCRDFEVMSYPTLRYFHENYEEGPKNLGEELEKGMDMLGHKINLVQYMITEQQKGRGAQFPTLQPYKHPNLLHLFENTNINAKYIFLVIDSPESTLGAQLALDFRDYKKIGVRYAVTTNVELMRTVKPGKFPYMMVVMDNNKSHVFPETMNTRERMRDAISEYVKPDVNVPDWNKQEVFTGKWIDSPVPDISSLMEAKSRKMLRDRVKKMGDVVFQADLESALRHSLKHEIGGTRMIKDEKLNALKAYIDVLIKYFPFGTEGKAFLMEIMHHINLKTSLDGIEIVNIVNKYDDDSKKVFSSKHQWIACDGSTPERRRFPCGLWKLFHYMTVQSAERKSEPKEVLHAMHGYVKNFFGCSDCSKHFQDMAIKKEMEGVTSSNSAVLWLWMAHNDVNKRLSGDQTEDPEFLKIQFPTKERCSACRKSDNTWDYIEVLRYLKNMYNNSNIRYIGADSSVILPGLEHQRSGRSLFEQIDASMCFILYVICFFFIVLLIKLFLKRGYRKKMYTHDLLGKV